MTEDSLIDRLKYWLGGLLESASIMWEALVNWLKNRRGW